MGGGRKPIGRCGSNDKIGEKELLLRDDRLEISNVPRKDLRVEGCERCFVVAGNRHRKEDNYLTMMLWRNHKGRLGGSYRADSRARYGVGRSSGEGLACGTRAILDHWWPREDSVVEQGIEGAECAERTYKGQCISLSRVWTTMTHSNETSAFVVHRFPGGITWQVRCIVPSRCT